MWIFWALYCPKYPHLAEFQITLLVVPALMFSVHSVKCWWTHRSTNTMLSEIQLSVDILGNRVLNFLKILSFCYNCEHGVKRPQSFTRVAKLLEQLIDQRQAWHQAQPFSFWEQNKYSRGWNNYFYLTLHQELTDCNMDEPITGKLIFITKSCKFG